VALYKLEFNSFLGHHSLPSNFLSPRKETMNVSIETKYCFNKDTDIGRPPLGKGESLPVYSILREGPLERERRKVKA